VENKNTELDHLINGADIVKFNKTQRIIQRRDTYKESKMNMDSKKNIRMETNGESTTVKTETEVVG